MKFILEQDIVKGPRSKVAAFRCTVARGSGVL